MKPYRPNSPSQEGAVRIMHTLRPGTSEAEEMAALHRKLEQELGVSLTRPDVLRIAVHREFARQCGVRGDIERPPPEPSGEEPYRRCAERNW